VYSRRFEGGTPYVAPNQGVLDRPRAEFGWDEAGEGVSPVGTTDVADATGDGARLQ